MLDYLTPLAIAVIAFAYARHRRSRMAAGMIPVLELTVRVPASTYRLAQSRPLMLVVSVLTGVSITFCPAFLVIFGGSIQRLFDWRVLACLLVTYLVPLFYMMLAAPVAQHAREHRKPSPARP
jgi:hypothetical protein